MKQISPLSASMQLMPATLFRILRRLDAEANKPWGEYPTGLAYYGGHARQDLKKPQTEPCWSIRCAELWPSFGYAAQAEVPYPNLPRKKCDNVITTPDGQTLWLEIKGAWKNYWSGIGKLGTYRSYLFHPLLPGLDKSKTHTAALDLEKLKSLRPPHADYAGLLLCGFDTDDGPMADDIRQFESLAHLDSPPWTTFRDHWPDPQRPQNHIRLWLWIRPTISQRGKKRSLQHTKIRSRSSRSYRSSALLLVLSDKCPTSSIFYSAAPNPRIALPLL